MMSFSCSSFTYRLQHLVSFLIYKFFCFCKSTWFLITYFYQHVIGMDPLLFQMVYFLSVSSLGFLLIIMIKPRVNSVENPSNLDLFYTAVSAMTTSSMSVVEMEFFSDNQLVVLTFLMFVGGDVFTSMIGLHCSLAKNRKSSKDERKVDTTSDHSTNSFDQIELGITTGIPNSEHKSKIDDEYLKYNSIRFLGFVVLGYFLLSHILGFIIIPIYLAIFPNTKNVLEKKGLGTFTFIVFTTVSTFSGCGFLPTNENMIVFNKNSGLLLILILPALFGNTLYPSGLRFCVWLVGKLWNKSEANFLLVNSKGEIGYFHWLSARHSLFLVLTVVGFILVQVLMFCCMEWNSEGLSALNYYERVVAAVFQAVNTRHTGETILDLSRLPPALWLLFLLMMYLPPYTSYLGTTKDEDDKNKMKKKKKKMKKRIENLMLSSLTYLVIAVILICLTERKNMEEDPLNFNPFNVIIEVVSAYGNVGYSKGYDCGAQLKPDPNCVNKWSGFSGKWSDPGKFILIVVMLFGRLKKYNTHEGRAWKLM